MQQQTFSRSVQRVPILPLKVEPKQQLRLNPRKSIDPPQNERIIAELSEQLAESTQQLTNHKVYQEQLYQQIEKYVEIIDYTMKLLYKLNEFMKSKTDEALNYSQGQLEKVPKEERHIIDKLHGLYTLNEPRLEVLKGVEEYQIIGEDSQQSIISKIQGVAKIVVDNIKIIGSNSLQHEKLKFYVAEKIAGVQGQQEKMQLEQKYMTLQLQKEIQLTNDHIKNVAGSTACCSAAAATTASNKNLGAQQPHLSAASKSETNEMWLEVVSKLVEYCTTLQLGETKKSHPQQQQHQQLIRDTPHQQSSYSNLQEEEISSIPLDKQNNSQLMMDMSQQILQERVFRIFDRHEQQRLQNQQQQQLQLQHPLQQQQQQQQQQHHCFQRQNISDVDLGSSVQFEKSQEICTNRSEKTRDISQYKRDLQQRLFDQSYSESVSIPIGCSKKVSPQKILRNQLQINATPTNIGFQSAFYNNQQHIQNFMHSRDPSKEEPSRSPLVRELRNLRMYEAAKINEQVSREALNLKRSTPFHLNRILESKGVSQNSRSASTQSLQQQQPLPSLSSDPHQFEQRIRERSPNETIFALCKSKSKKQYLMTAAEEDLTGTATAEATQEENQLPIREPAMPIRMQSVKSPIDNREPALHLRPASVTSYDDDMPQLSDCYQSNYQEDQLQFTRQKFEINTLNNQPSAYKENINSSQYESQADSIKTASGPPIHAPSLSPQMQATYQSVQRNHQEIELASSDETETRITIPKTNPYNIDIHPSSNEIEEQHQTSDQVEEQKVVEQDHKNSKINSTKKDEDLKSLYETNKKQLIHSSSKDQINFQSITSKKQGACTGTFSLVGSMHSEVKSIHQPMNSSQKESRVTMNSDSKESVIESRLRFDGKRILDDNDSLVDFDNKEQPITIVSPQRVLAAPKVKNSHETSVRAVDIYNTFRLKRTANQSTAPGTAFHVSEQECESDHSHRESIQQIDKQPISGSSIKKGYDTIPETSWRIMDLYPSYHSKNKDEFNSGNHLNLIQTELASHLKTSRIQIDNQQVDGPQASLSDQILQEVEDQSLPIKKKNLINPDTIKKDKSAHHSNSLTSPNFSFIHPRQPQVDSINRHQIETPISPFMRTSKDNQSQQVRMIPDKLQELSPSLSATEDESPTKQPAESFHRGSVRNLIIPESHNISIIRKPREKIFGERSITPPMHSSRSSTYREEKKESISSNQSNQQASLRSIIQTLATQQSESHFKSNQTYQSYEGEDARVSQRPSIPRSVSPMPGRKKIFEGVAKDQSNEMSRSRNQSQYVSNNSSRMIRSSTNNPNQPFSVSPDQPREIVAQSNPREVLRRDSTLRTLRDSNRQPFVELFSQNGLKGDESNRQIPTSLSKVKLDVKSNVASTASLATEGENHKNYQSQKLSHLHESSTSLAKYLSYNEMPRNALENRNKFSYTSNNPPHF